MRSFCRTMLASGMCAHRGWPRLALQVEIQPSDMLAPELDVASPSCGATLCRLPPCTEPRNVRVGATTQRQRLCEPQTNNDESDSPESCSPGGRLWNKTLRRMVAATAAERPGVGLASLSTQRCGGGLSPPSPPSCPTPRASTGSADANHAFNCGSGGRSLLPLSRLQMPEWT